MELLSPAGDRASLIAAVQNGADAVYFGARGFNARRGADNFAGDGLREAVAYCHLRGVKVYITLNTMVRQDELPALEETIQEIYQSGADAFIVQDLGVAEAVRRIAPEMALHASTQMAVHNMQGVKYLMDRGFTRVVLAREMDFGEIRQCADLDVELEVFGHGALCVSCSGQCLLSSMIGGRSGNRGMCAQPCRMKYRANGKEGYFLSPRDLMSADMLNAYRSAGVSSLKLEGRLKRPEYVAVVTGVYRKLLDGKAADQQDLEALRQIFNRGGFTHGYGPGAEESTLMYHARPNHAGVAAGSCEKRGVIHLEKDVDASDTLALHGSGEDIPVQLSGKKGQNIPCLKAEKGMTLVRLISDKQMKAAQQSWEGEHRAQPLHAALTLKIGQPAHLQVKDAIHTVTVRGATVQQAQQRPLDAARVENQIRKTGGTAFIIDSFSLEADSQAFLPVSELNTLRREALDQFSEIFTAHQRINGKLGDCRYPKCDEPAAQLRVQSGHVDILKAALQKGADQIVFAPQDMRRLDDALMLPPFFLALPPVMRQEELLSLHAWAAKHHDRILGVYLSNISHFGLAWPGSITADYAMNIANNLSLSQLQADAYTPSVELTARQIEQLGGHKDLIVHGFLPLMHLRHCPNRAMLNLPGKHSACRLCDQQHAPALPALEDRTGAKFPLRRIAYESGCILQLLNSVPLMLLRKADKLPKAGVWRILLDDAASLDVISLYRAALRREDFTRLPAWEKYQHLQSTTGHYFRGVE